MRKLEQRVSVITGAGSGMGKAIARLFAAEGSKVVATDINGERLESLEKEIRMAGGEITTLVANMANEADIEKMIQLAVTTYGTLDILVNNAGIGTAVVHRAGKISPHRVKAKRAHFKIASVNSHGQPAIGIAVCGYGGAPLFYIQIVFVPHKGVGTAVISIGCGKISCHGFFYFFC